MVSHTFMHYYYTLKIFCKEGGRTLKLVLSGLRVAARCEEVVSNTTSGAEAEGERDS